MQARHFKIVLWISALIVVWQLGRSDYVLDSMFVFAATGAVPGTDVVLNPNQVFLALSVVLGLALVLIFATNLRRGIIRLFSRGSVHADKAVSDEPFSATEAAEAEGITMQQQFVTPTASVQPAAAEAYTRKKLKPSPVVVISKPVPKPSKLALALRIWAGATALRFRHLSEAVAKHFPRVVAVLTQGVKRLQTTAVITAAGLKWAGVWLAKECYALSRIVAGVLAGWAILLSRFIRRNLVRTGIFAGKTSVRLWRKAEPHLRIFDYWLGVQYHTYLDAAKHNETVKSAAHLKKEAARVLASTRTQIRSVASRFAGNNDD